MIQKSTSRLLRVLETEFFIDNLLVRVHFIIEMIRWTGLAPWEVEFPFKGSLTSTFLRFYHQVVGSQDMLRDMRGLETVMEIEELLLAFAMARHAAHQVCV